MSSPLEMRKDLSGLQQFVKELQRNESKYYKILGELIQDAFLKEVQKRAPEDTGEYKKSWRKGRVTVNGANIKITIETPHGDLYLILEEEGSDPHTIDGPVMISGVGWRFIKEHPGFPPIPHVEPSMRHIMDTQLPKLNDKALKMAFPRVFG